MSQPSQRSLREYRRRINAVIDHIQRHLGEDLAMEDLARVAHFSLWHFHRVFAAVTGETVQAWIKRTRVQAAADRLTYDPDVPVTTVAYELGFSSPSVLNRAFRDRFGCTPTQWRTGAQAARTEDQALRTQLQVWEHAMSDHGGSTPATSAQGSADMEPITVQDLPAYRIAYLRHLGPYDHGPIGELWEEFSRWAGPRDLFGPGKLSFGISHDNPEVTPPDRCRYDAGVEVPAGFTADGPVNLATLPAGKYAVLHVRCVPDAIGAQFGRLFGWLGANGWQPGNGPTYQRYGDDCQLDPVTGAMTCDICVPVRPL
ncbi:MAG: AraC family transcriptional regulator [Candidatus Krumholzibacteriia bacterium]